MVSPQVSVVLDPEFGPHLETQLRHGPVWLRDTPLNRRAAEKYWAENANQSHLTGVTIFNGSHELSVEDILLGQIEVIALHHAPRSSPEPYQVFVVIGASLTPQIEAELRLFGFGTFQETEAGFSAQRYRSSTDS